MTALKITAIGDSRGVILPEEMLARLNVREGDIVYALDAPDGSVRLVPHDPILARKMEKAEDIMQRYKDTLHTLAQ